MFIPQNNPFCVKVRKSQYLQNSTFKHKNKRDQFDIFCDGWDEDKGDIPDIRKSKAGLLGAVHILRQPKTGVRRPPLPPRSAMVIFWLTPPPPLVSNCQHLDDPPSPPRQPSSSFARRPFCTAIFYVDFLTWQNGGYSFTWVQLAYYMTLHNVHG